MGTGSQVKNQAAAISLGFNVLSTVGKAVAAILTGSMSLLSEAAHSAADVAASLVTFWSVRAAAAPPDDEHPYGHGKIEALTGFVESALLIAIVGYIAFESITRFITPHPPIQQVGLGMIVMGASAAGAFTIAAYVRGVAKRARSMALETNAQHLMVDFWTSIGVLGALLLTNFTGWTHADAGLALVFAIWLAYGAFKMARRAFHELIDRRLSDEDQAAIEAIIDSQQGVLSHHRLRTRMSGETRYIDMHIVVPRDWTVVQGHDVADALEKRLVTQMHPAVVVVHVDPYDEEK